MMTRLVDALCELGLEGEESLGGQLVKLAGERFPVYVAEAGGGVAYFTWCEDPQERAVEFHRDPITAIQAALQRAAHGGKE